MKELDRLADCIGGALGERLRSDDGTLAELRLRPDRPARLRRLDGGEEMCEPLSRERFTRALLRMMGDSLYACEEELKQGYFTMDGGIRVGVCGRLSRSSGCISSMANIGSVCIRIPREIRSEEALRLWRGRPENLLILSPPGLGKTTMARQLARIASEDGFSVAIADERRELAACREGIPTFDVGERTDVMDGCPKAVAMEMMLRACAPELIVVDEIGGEDDAAAIRDCARCGVAVIATAHAARIEDVQARLEILFREKLFRRAALLGPQPGMLSSVWESREESEKGEEKC